MNALGFDVNDRRETWLFSETGAANNGPKIYRRLQCNLVQYGSDPEQYLEPVNISDFDDAVSWTGPISYRDGGWGRISGFQVMTGRFSPMHSFNDYDAAVIGA